MVGRGLAVGVVVSGGGATPTFAFSQQQIATQQHFSQAADSLQQSSENLDTATQSIKGVSPGQVFTTGADEMGGVTRVLANDARRSDRFSATRDAARSFRGGSS